MFGRFSIETLLTAAATTFLVGASASASILIDHFSTDSLAHYQNPTQSRTAFTYDAANQRVNMPSAVTYAMAYATTIGTFEQPGSSYTFSVDFLTDNMDRISNNNTAAVGFSTTTNGFYTNNSALAPHVGMEVSVRSLSTLALKQHILRIRGEGGSARHGEITLSSSLAFELAANAWHRLVFTVTRDGNTSNYNLSAQVLDANGDQLTNAYLSGSINMASNANATPLLSTDHLFAGFAGARAAQSGFSTGSNAMDNFVVIPEPASLAFVSLGGLAMLARRRRA